MKKPAIIFAALMGYFLLCGYGPTVPHPGGTGSLIMAGLMIALPIGSFIWLVGSFHSWHRTFHRRMVREGLQMRRSS